MSDEEKYTLTMPFVAVESAGGPYDDKSYAAGFEVGRFWVVLEHGKPPFWEGFVRTPNVEQIDLICMKFNYVIEQRQDHPNEFTLIRVRKGGDSVPLGGS